jgi:hypothetical protein
MNQGITVKAPLDEATMLTGLRWYYRANRIRQLFLLLLFFGAGVMLFYAVQMSVAPAHDTIFHRLLYIVIPSSVLAVILYWLKSLIERRQFLVGIKSSPLFDSTPEYYFDDDVVKMTSDHSKSESSWAIYMKTVSTPEGALMFHQKRLFGWLPKTAFNSAADYTRFLDLLAVKTKHSKLG